MRIVQGISRMIALSKIQRLNRKRIGLVPTMGALHGGHLSLIRRARRENDFVVVSIFVNPAQFGTGEDFGKYPRNLRRDARLCKREGVDIIFYPDAKKMYPYGYSTYVDLEALSGVLCGKSRPGHFRGVATIVAKLFNIIQPDIAYFGQKDAQQAVIIKRMARDLNIPVTIRVMPIIRERDGLAMSSRNSYLNKKERADAVALSQSLNLAKNMIKNGTRDVRRIISRMRNLITSRNTVRIDYISVVDYDTLKPLKKISDNCLIAIAVWIGKTRLIDNMIFRKP